MFKWLEINEQLEVWKTSIIQILADVFLDGEYENWIIC